VNKYREQLVSLAMDCLEWVAGPDTYRGSSPPLQSWQDAKWKEEDKISSEINSRKRRERVESLRRFYEREMKKAPCERVGL
jgi:hypothetical protein